MKKSASPALLLAGSGATSLTRRVSDDDDVTALELDYFVHDILPWIAWFPEFRSAEFNSTS